MRLNNSAVKKEKVLSFLRRDYLELKDTERYSSENTNDFKSRDCLIIIAKFNI